MSTPLAIALWVAPAAAVPTAAIAYRRTRPSRVLRIWLWITAPIAGFLGSQFVFSPDWPIAIPLVALVISGLTLSAAYRQFQSHLMRRWMRND
jgi:hypothetical protein